MAKDYIRILGRNYELKREALEGMAGQCDRHSGIITISPNASQFDLKDVVLHEVMHAVLYQQGANHAYPLEESFVRPLASGLTGVFQDNPKLARWLIQQIKG